MMYLYLNTFWKALEEELLVSISLLSNTGVIFYDENEIISFVKELNLTKSEGIGRTL
jgi:hypothetical protein